MAVKPTKPTVPPAPSRANPGTDFAIKADTFAAFQSPFADYMEGIADFTDARADDALAAAIGGDLPPITGQAGKYIRVNTAGDAVEFAPINDPENRIINGAFDVWQRGTSSTSAGYVAADRWRNDFSGGTVTQSRQAVTLGTLYGSNSPASVLRQAVTGQTLTTHFALTQQRIEGVRSYAGQTVTILGWAQRTSGGGNMAVEVVQNFGTGGSPSAQVTGTGQLVTLTGSIAAFAITVAVPSVSGKTLGTNGDDYLALNFWTSAGSTFNTRAASLGLQTIGVDLWGIHIKVGTHTTAACDLYKSPKLGPELARCQRYYQTTRFVLANTSFGGSSGGALVQMPLRVVMRGTPTITLTPDNGTGAVVVAMGSGAIRQNILHSAVTESTVAMDAEL